MEYPQGWGWSYVFHVTRMLTFLRLLGPNRLLWQAYVWQDGAIPFHTLRQPPGWPHLAPADGWPDEFEGTSCTASFRNSPRWDSTSPASLRWPFALTLSFFFCLSPVATSSHHLAVPCQFSCSPASSLWCTSSSLMFFSRWGWALPRYWGSFLCWTYLWPDFYLF